MPARRPSWFPHPRVLAGIGAWVGLAAALGSGCGGPSPNGTVTGVLKHHGKPLAGAMILFIPPNGPAAGAVTTDDGRYELTSAKPGDGVRPGRCAVAVRAADPQTRPLPIHHRFGAGETSDLFADVKPGPNVIDLEIPEK
ncbi:MAG: carboxypeptidase-like regulatory domain-containing protein [Fimbriiglobus sp.]